MTIALHTIYAVTVDDVVIDQIQGQTISPGVSEALGGGDGQLYASFVNANRIEPTVGFTTTGLTAALAKFAPEGFPLVAADNAVLFLQKRVEGARLSPGATHLSATINEGIVVPRTLSADQELATLESEIIATYDGTNAPIVLATGQSLTGSPTTTERFVAGPVNINGVQLESIVSIEVDFGITLSIPAHDGHVYPLYVTITAIQPIITIRTLDALSLSTFGIDGTAQGATPCEFYLRACAQGGSRIANNVASHIKIVNTASKGMIIVGSSGGEHGGDITNEIRIVPASDGTVNPLTITTASTIPGAL